MFIVFGCIDYNSDTLLGAYTTLELAINAIQDHKFSGPRCVYDDYTISKCAVDVEIDL